MVLKSFENARESDRTIITFIADRFSRQMWGSKGMKRSANEGKSRRGEVKRNQLII